MWRRATRRSPGPKNVQLPRMRSLKSARCRKWLISPKTFRRLLQAFLSSRARASAKDHQLERRSYVCKQHLPRCFPWQQDKSESGRLERASGGGAACEGTRGDGGLEGLGRKASGLSAPAGRVHSRSCRFARGRREAVRGASAFYDLPRRNDRDHAHSPDTGRLARYSAGGRARIHPSDRAGPLVNAKVLVSQPPAHVNVFHMSWRKEG